MRRIYSLDMQNCGFPDPNDAERDGLIAFGGDLSPNRLLSAYSQGIFPWYSPGDPILWWSPDPRLVIFPKKLHISKSLKKEMRKKKYRVTIDQAFSSVITECAKIRLQNGEETWITEPMKQAYLQLHLLGFAHSVETWIDDKLIGGLYGVSIGRSFFGESMFSKKSNASKIALVALVKFLQAYDFDILDCQVSTDHLINMGAENISRDLFLKLLDKSLTHNTLCGRWNF
ncbi:Leucyl/phenylalanyl-tRNA--protein transferase [Candidatus Magnetomorum sp. HK-1]|nr:Leucyl/phenylalanyl-tRNA--protein transferase [Candidatus Magnetomorum sp. HK-1]